MWVSMMTKAAKMLALRKWFNPDNYDALLDLTVEELRQEFRHRQNMFYSLETAIERQRENLNGNPPEKPACS